MAAPFDAGTLGLHIGGLRVPTNGPALGAFYDHVTRIWLRSLRRPLLMERIPVTIPNAAARPAEDTAFRREIAIQTNFRTLENYWRPSVPPFDLCQLDLFPRSRFSDPRFQRGAFELFSNLDLFPGRSG